MDRFNIRDLAAIQYAIGITHWTYKAGEHTAAQVMKPGYWNEATDMLGSGDWIFVSGHHFALQLYVMQTGPRVVVSLVSAGGTLGNLPAPDHPDDYLAELATTG